MVDFTRPASEQNLGSSLKLHELILRLEGSEPLTVHERVELRNAILKLEGNTNLYYGGGGGGGGSIIDELTKYGIVRYSSGRPYFYTYDEAGFRRANSDAVSGETIVCYAGSIAGDHTLKAGMAYIGFNTIFTGTITLSGSPFLLLNMKIDANEMYLYHDGNHFIRRKDSNEMEFGAVDDISWAFLDNGGQNVVTMDQWIHAYSAFAFDFDDSDDNNIVQPDMLGYIVDTDGGAKTLTFDVDSIVANVTLIVKNNGSNTLTVQDDGGDIDYTFDGAANIVMAPGECRWLFCRSLGESDAEIITLFRYVGVPYGSFYTNAAIATTMTVQNTFYEIDAATAWITGPLNVCTFTDPRLTVPVAGTYRITWNLSGSVGTAGQVLNVGVLVSGTVANQGRARVDYRNANRILNVSGTAIVALTAGQTVSLAVRNVTSAAKVYTAQNGNLTLEMVGG